MPTPASRADRHGTAYGRPRLVAASDDGGVTLSAAEIAQRTGVAGSGCAPGSDATGSPAAVRLANNARRYAAHDVRRVLAVRRAVERGVPLPDAIAHALNETREASVPLDLGRVVEHAPVP